MQPFTIYDKIVVAIFVVVNAFSLSPLSSLCSGIDLDSTTIGIAFLGTMCNDQLSFGLTQDGGSSLNSVESIAAHELGHIFNMRHDDDEGTGPICIRI